MKLLSWWFLLVVVLLFMLGFFVVMGFFTEWSFSMKGAATTPPLGIFSDMARQPRINAQSPSRFFADGRGNRAPVQGTIPLGYRMPQYGNGKNDLDADIDFSRGGTYRDTGKFGIQWGTGIPVEVNASLIQRGRERFNIHCAVCHGATGWGDGIATKYGLVGVANLHLMRIRMLPEGEIFDVMTHGKNLMMGLGAQIPISDRWAIIAYLRALQRSQQTKLEDVPALERVKLETLP